MECICNSKIADVFTLGALINLYEISARMYVPYTMSIQHYFAHHLQTIFPYCLQIAKATHVQVAPGGSDILTLNGLQPLIRSVSRTQYGSAAPCGHGGRGS